jgi:hypothetical protein
MSNKNRAVVVIDRGWIAAGDVREDGDHIVLDRAVWVFRWERIGFDGVIADPTKADIRKFPNGFIVPKRSVIFRVSVNDDWGMHVYAD